jgi:membrane protein implicated in regulation of membrane protease activity
MIVGATLLGAEMFVVDAQFYLVFFGIAAALVGLAGLAGLAMPDWAQWLAFAVLAVVSMLAFRRRLYGLLRRPRSGRRAAEPRRSSETARAAAARRDLPRRLPRLELERAQYRRRRDRAR